MGVFDHSFCTVKAFIFGEKVIFKTSLPLLFRYLIVLAHMPLILISFILFKQILICHEMFYFSSAYTLINIIIIIYCLRYLGKSTCLFTPFCNIYLSLHVTMQ